MREALRRELPGLEEAVPLASLTAYGVGGPAEFLVRAGTTGVLVHAVLTARELGLPVTVLGRCTNVLVGDAGVPGLTVLARNEGTTLHGNVLRAEAGVELPGLVADLAGQGLAGLTFAANIPGSVGGAVVGNAGAYGESVSDACSTSTCSRRARSTSSSRTAWTSATAPRCSSRGATSSSSPPRSSSTTATATSCCGASPTTRRCARASTRSSTRAAAATSRTPRGRCRRPGLIEDAGLKGLRVGRAHVSEKHANFLVAEPGATADDITALAAEVVRRVHETSGYELSEEVRRLGFA